MQGGSVERAREVLARMESHRSVREYAPLPVPREHLACAVAAARQAASSSNVQAYGAIRVTDPDERERLAESCGGQRQVVEAGAFLAIVGDLRRDALVARRAGQRFVANFEAFLVAVIDASLFAQNLVLALESMGYGTCYVGGLRNRIAEVDALLELPELVLPLYGLCVGVPRAWPDVKPRLAPHALLHEDRYPSDRAVLDAVDEYDGRMRPHFAARGRADWSWSGAVARKFAEPLRPHLEAYYARKGIEFGDGA